MAQPTSHRVASCCYKSFVRDLTRQLQPRRSMVTIQRGRPEKIKPPEDLPDTFWSQLPNRLRPDHGRREIIIHQAPPAEREQCKEPLKVVDAAELARLDPTGARSKLFDAENRDRAKPGDILLATFKGGEPFSGVIMSIKGSGPHKAVLLRNHLTSIGTEMSIKVHSPGVQSMEIVQRAPKRKRRAKLTYLRKPKHDVGSVQKIVDQYMRERALLTGKKVASTGFKRKKGRR
ncbi:ribosomal protein L19 [Cyphellophora europaea CBS 101466]|uniref:Ribosomal protein L19 n=1 Tax=Cyphellophora europaea (strain CBS 101466) TaxID=1220924 RepID=W2S3B2_CYPE1|nr:ribosomal protein L19 [Cyphellophora europaea CBS 101466]ETN42523.1 ribosomal protein L19 [Cyphellophora europaea CBS 101466]